jgi:inosine-uridine nucleoside N-ribohydrolase
MKLKNLPTTVLVAVVFAAFAVPCCAMGEAAAPVPIFLDTDVCVDAGDVAAITFLNGLADRGEAKILGITCVTSYPYAPGCADAVCRWCGRPDVPMGTLKEAGLLNLSDYAKHVAQNWPNRYPDGADHVPDAVTVFRKVMSQQPDHSVVLVSIGPFRNLANFLRSKPDAISPLSGRELIEKKVKLLSSMGGIFKPTVDLNLGTGKIDHCDPATYTEFNIVEDLPSAQYVARNWPTPIVFSGFEIGEPIKVDAAVVRAASKSPQAYCLLKQNNNRPAWDQTSILYGVRGLSDYWTAATGVRIDFDDKGRTRWRADPTSHHEYLEAKMSDAELGKIIGQIEGEAGHGPDGKAAAEAVNTQ